MMRKRPSVTQLVDFAKCEKLAILKLDRREELDAVRRGAVSRGVAAHKKMESAAFVDGRCFVASFAYGVQANETKFLRNFRDTRLLKNSMGRTAVIAYYALSPWAVAVLRRTPGGAHFARMVVSAVVASLARSASESAEDSNGY